MPRRSEAAAARERLDVAYACFRDVLEAGLQPALTAEWEHSLVDRGDWRQGEFDCVVKGYTALIHEDIVKLIAIAERHGGRLFIGETGGEAAILFVHDRVPGPDGEPSPSEQLQKRARSKAKTRSRRAQ